MILITKLKYFLRQNPFYKKYLEVRVDNFRFWIHNLKYYYNKYSWRKDKTVDGHTVYFIIDPDVPHPGLVDRLNSIVGAYYIAKTNGFDYKVIFTHPFILSDYLACASHNWKASFNDLSYSLKNSKLLAYNGAGKVPKLRKRVKQYHIYCYMGYNILFANKIGDYNKIWRELFMELFQPVPVLRQALQVYEKLQEKGFIAAHLRFANALENFESSYYNFLDKEQKEILIQKCLDAIRFIITQNHEEQVVVFSDSTLFLDRVQKELPVIVLDGKIGHISFSNSDDVILKTFVDFFMISQSKQVIRIWSSEMYMSTFPYYAAIAGGKVSEDYRL